VAGGSARDAIPFVGLTGGIGTGKSEALLALHRLGAATLSSDAVVHDLLSGDEIRDELVRRLGRGVAPEGPVERDAVAAIVFERPKDREWLEGYLWPRVGEQIARWRTELEQAEPRPRAAVVEVPLLFESGMDSVFDHTIAVVADEEVRAERAGARGHAGLASRESRQLTQDEKAARADFTVRNDGTLEQLEQELSEVLRRIAA
jgi:dephospho-CoA kinase